MGRAMFGAGGATPVSVVIAPGVSAEVDVASSASVAATGGRYDSDVL